MSMDDASLGRADLNFAEAADVERFVETLARFESGEIDSGAWRAFRLVHGTYGQRQEGSHSMLRVKIPQGILHADQLETIAEVARRFSRGFAHLTTRQNFQMHFIPLDRVGDAMSQLAAAGLTTREACGNAVRNVTAPATAGVAADEAFDVTPYARALTRYLLRHPLSSSLPRKFKIAFSGGGRDHAFVQVNDIGFTAGILDGKRVFRVTVAGGTAILCRTGRELFAALPADQICSVAEAVLQVFHARGDREHRHKNRLKFLVAQLGWDAFAAEVLQIFSDLKIPPLSLGIDDAATDDASPPQNYAEPPSLAALHQLMAADAPHGPGIVPRYLPRLEASQRFLRTNVTAQKQPGYSLVTLTVPLGDLSSGRLLALAQLARAFSDGTVRTTHGQNLILRWVPNAALPQLTQRLAALGLDGSDPNSLADVTSCPGAETCKLAVTQSRGVAQLLSTHFAAQSARHEGWLDSLGSAPVHVSGCPNGCGLHHVAAIGLQGGMRKVGGRPVPQYFLYVGGDGAHFGRVVAKIPARRVPAAVERLIDLYQRERQAGEDAATFFRRIEGPTYKSLLLDLETLSEADASPLDYVDLAETTAFAPTALEGECAA